MADRRRARYATFALAAERRGGTWVDGDDEQGHWVFEMTSFRIRVDLFARLERAELRIDVHSSLRHGAPGSGMNRERVEKLRASFESP